MTKKDFVAIAARFRETKLLFDDKGNANIAEIVSRRLAHEVADVLAQGNPRFDRNRFLDACGVSR